MSTTTASDIPTDIPTCQVPGCGCQIAGRLLMCEVHWTMLPAPRRVAVTRYHETLGSDSTQYKAAAEAAIHYVVTRLRFARVPATTGANSTFKNTFNSTGSSIPEKGVAEGTAF